MANLSPWKALLGTGQGRIVPTGWIPPQGAWLFCLGSDAPGYVRKLKGNDYTQVAQTCDLTGVQFVRFSGRFRPPSTVPAGIDWFIELQINGVTYAFMNISGGRQRDRFDMAAFVHDLAPGNHTIAFRLTMVGAPGTVYEAEFPAAYVDAIVLDSATTSPVLMNREAEPGETNVPATADIILELADPTGVGVNDSQTKVYVQGILAFDGGAFQTNYQGANSALSSPLPWVSRIVIDPQFSFGSTQVVEVRVVSVLNSGGPVFDQTYSYTTADVVGPKVVSASAPGHSTIRVLFDERVLQVLAANPNDALNPSNYVVTLLDGAPAVTPEIVGVLGVTSNEVDLQTDIEMTRGATYRVTVHAVEDPFSNEVMPPDDSAVFTGFRCEVPEGRDFNVERWFDFLRREDDTRDWAKFAAIYQETTDFYLCKLDGFPDVLDPDLAPEEWVDLMLADLGNPFAFNLTALEKQRLLSVLVAIYRQKGTGQGIINAIRFFLGIEVTITVAWHLPSSAKLGTCTLGKTGTPGTFILGTGNKRLRLTMIINSPVVLTDELRSRILGLANYMKRGVTHVKLKEPTVAVVAIPYWRLGFGRLGKTGTPGTARLSR